MKTEESCDIFLEKPIGVGKITFQNVVKLNISVCKKCGVNLQRENFGKKTLKNYCDACIDAIPRITLDAVGISL